MTGGSKTVHVRIEGRVQGVWYRAWTEEQAKAHGLAGWVRNRADGTVEALFHGPSAAVDAMLAACHQGPPAARVTAVIVSPAPAPHDGGFHRRATA